MFGSSAIVYDRTKKVHEKCDIIKIRVLVFLGSLRHAQKLVCVKTGNETILM